MKSSGPTVLSLAIILLGLIGFSQLPVREYPDVDPPIVSVTTFYRGASPSVVETEVTNILEEQFATLEGVKTLTSSSVEQGSVITIEFELGRDNDAALQDVQTKIAQAQRNLPRDIDPPVVSKFDAQGDPIMSFSVKGEDISLRDLTRLAEETISRRIQNIPGVGNVSVVGGQRREIARADAARPHAGAGRLPRHGGGGAGARERRRAR